LVDFPFSDSGEGTRFLSGLPVSPEDRGKIPRGNADALLKLAPRAG
jgi:predicted TIM-barrel fold metal-dependent hydrolase